MAVMFHSVDHPPEEARVLSLMEAAALGYHISLRGSHLTLRCPYSSPLSHFVEVLRGDVVYGDLASFNYFVDAVCGCFCFFPPGEGSGFRDCRSDRPVPTPEQLPGC